MYLSYPPLTGDSVTNPACIWVGLIYFCIISFLLVSGQNLYPFGYRDKPHSALADVRFASVYHRWGAPCKGLICTNLFAITLHTFVVGFNE